jgi:hypothetical protein
MEAKEEGDEYQEENSVGGGTYEAWYYCTPQTRAAGAPIKPLRTFEDGEFSNVQIIDADHAEIQQLLASPAAKRDKAIAIVRKDIELRAR